MLHTIFAPAARLMSRLRFSSKFALSGAVAGALLLWLGLTALGQLHERVKMIESEQAGIVMMRNMQEWNKVLIENRRIVITSAVGDASVRTRLKQQAEVIDKTLAHVEADVARYRPLFDMGPETKGLRDGWVDLQKKLEALPLDKDFAQKGFVAHASEYERNYAYMRDLGNRSRMALDPDLDLFYLGFPLANNTGKTAGIVVRLAAYSTLNVTRGEITPKDRIYYEVNDARLADTFSGVETMLRQSMKANPAVEKKLAKTFEDLLVTTNGLTSFLRKNFIEAPTLAVTQQQIAQAAQASIDASWALCDLNADIMSEVLAERSSHAATLRNVLAALLVAGFALSVWLFAGMYFGIRQGLSRVTGAAQAIARGELGKVPAAGSRDELADLLGELERTDRSLASMIVEVRSAAHTIRTSSEEIAAGNQDLSQRTEEQASSLEETASSMEELAGNVKQNAQNARQANELTATAASIAEKGGKAVGDVVSTMSSINDASKKIADIIGVIDGIAFQTNILALNAAVEAARAGEQGRGFAVVAGEVRNLAQRSAGAAKEIRSLISASVSEVGNGMDLVAGAGRTMDEIVTSVRRVADLMGEITAASVEQSSGIEQVNQAVTQMDQVTQQNAALVEEAAAAAESMQEQAQSLATAVAVFKLEGDAPVSDAREAVRGTGGERRGPGRATNVAHLPAQRPVAPAAAAERAPTPMARTGTDDGWTEF